MCVCFRCVWFFKQKTAYEMRISDWSSDVCSSDLAIVSAPLCQVGWSQARILPAQDRGLVPFLDLEFVAREHRAHRVADILKPGRGRGQHNRCNVPVAAQFKRQALIFEVDQERAIVVATIGVATGDAAGKIGRAHVWTPVTNAHLVCRLLLEKKNITYTFTTCHSIFITYIFQ